MCALISDKGSAEQGGEGRERVGVGGAEPRCESWVGGCLLGAGWPGRVTGGVVASSRLSFFFFFNYVKKSKTKNKRKKRKIPKSKNITTTKKIKQMYE